MMARGSVRAGSVLSSATQIGPYQPSKATSTERKAMTIAATIAIDISGSAAAEFAGAVAVNAGADGAIKQPITSMSSMSPTETEMPPVTARPSRRPTQCNPVDTDSMDSAAARLCAAAGAQNPEQHNQARVAQRAGKSAGQP